MSRSVIEMRFCQQSYLHLESELQVSSEIQAVGSKFVQQPRTASGKGDTENKNGRSGVSTRISTQEERCQFGFRYLAAASFGQQFPVSLNRRGNPGKFQKKKGKKKAVKIYEPVSGFKKHQQASRLPRIRLQFRTLGVG